MIVFKEFCSDVNMLRYTLVSNIIAVLSLTACAIYISDVEGQGPVDDFCMNCICERGCAITYDFWLDAGKPTINGDRPGSDNAFNNCYEDFFCSSKAIQNYMYRYQKDCNNDGKINCVDHAAIHQHGAEACGGKENDDFQFQVYNCLNRRRK